MTHEGPLEMAAITALDLPEADVEEYLRTMSSPVDCHFSDEPNVDWEWRK